LAGLGFDFAAEAFTFIEELDRLETPQAVMDAMERSLALFGFENFIITGLPNPQEKIEGLILLKKWPIEWYTLYTREAYDRFDPVIRLCRSTVQPFEWAKASYHRDLEPVAEQVMQGAKAFGMERGFCLPVHGLNGQEACLSMSGQHLDLTQRTKPAIHLMAMYAFERARHFAYRTGTPLNPLTPREREALIWAAHGKSAADTGQILGVTERTITAHIAGACQKLGALNKTHAVARAMRHRLIQL
jgi:LuxR family transcriptional regulator, quorum-sensing system regulator BjaR1